MDECLLQTLSEGAANIGLHIGMAEKERFAVYHREILLWNRRINLISERSARDIVLRHFLDSLTAAPLVERTDGALIDLGSGGGFPGIPLRIMMPALNLSLVEPSRKKSSFLSHIVRSLRLDGVRVIRERTETLTTQTRLAGSFDTVVSRAAFKLPDLVRIASFFLKPGGQLIAMKGAIPEPEMAGSERIAEQIGMLRTACRAIPGHGRETSTNLITYKRAFP